MSLGVWMTVSSMAVYISRKQKEFLAAGRLVPLRARGAVAVS
jgi:hypothetical protein